MPIVITTNAGLWRYKIGVPLYYTSKECLYRIELLGSYKTFSSNAFGEELMHWRNAEKGIERACLRSNDQCEI